MFSEKGEDFLPEESMEAYIFDTTDTFISGKPVAFVESKEEAGSFAQDFLLFHNKSLDVQANPFSDSDPDGTDDPLAQNRSVIRNKYLPQIHTDR